MSRTTQELNKLRESDIYSLMLFVLYRAKDIPEYSSLSELAYILDKDNLLKLCEYFGGLTITIPRIDDLESLIYALILYQYVNIDKMPYDEAVKLIGYKSHELRKVKSDYIKICEVLDKYSFVRE